ncbi:hypothetical protein L2E82_27295 [Cichorium intybus]|uniref:Uncharacterized protein n=1 Tax=Cichorium intybus TaxID=13427 RepID=A0ACB9CSZ2_CICIN|nr:hypothetical protein L2E82_27295 [Cichorium intybus]
MENGVVPILLDSKDRCPLSSHSYCIHLLNKNKLYFSLFKDSSCSLSQKREEDKKFAHRDETFQLSASSLRHFFHI